MKTLLMLFMKALVVKGLEMEIDNLEEKDIER